MCNGKFRMGCNRGMLFARRKVCVCTLLQNRCGVKITVVVSTTVVVQRCQQPTPL